MCKPPFKTAEYFQFPSMTVVSLPPGIILRAGM